MRTVSAGMAEHLAGDAHYRVWMVRLDLHDGTIIGLTSNSDDVEHDLGDGAGLVTYLAGTGANISDVDLVLGLETSNFEVTGPIADVVTLDALLGGRFNDAEVRLFQVNPERASFGELAILFGAVTDAQPNGGEFTLEVSGETAKLNATIGRTMSAQCSADFGDLQCAVVPEELAASVVGVTDDLEFAVSFAGGPFADGYFNFGKVEFSTGPLAGTRPIQIFTWTSAGDVTLLVPAAEMPELGDALIIKRGCSKLRRHSDTTIPTCTTYDNVARMRAFPDCTGSDQAMRFPVPGTANA